MKLTLKELTALKKMQEKIDLIKTAVADRAYHKKDTNDAETDGTIEGLDCASAGIEQAMEQHYLLINNI